MSDCAFNQDLGPTANDLLEKALQKAYDEGAQSVYDKIEDLLRRKAAERKAADGSNKESN